MFGLQKSWALNLKFCLILIKLLDRQLLFFVVGKVDTISSDSCWYLTFLVCEIEKRKLFLSVIDERFAYIIFVCLGCSH